MKKIILVGAGGHALSCIDVIEAEKKYKIIGLIDNKKNSKLIHILSDGIGMNFAKIEYLKLKILDEINNIKKN